MMTEHCGISDLRMIMEPAMYEFIQANGRWPVIVVLFASLLACLLAFSRRKKKLGLHNTLLDVRFWYTPANVRQLMKSLGGKGRRHYATSLVTLDFAFPLIYGAIFAILIVNLYGREQAQLLIWVAPLTVVADLLENTSIAILAWTYPEFRSSLARLSAFCTVSKWVMFAASLLVIVIGLIVTVHGLVWGVEAGDTALFSLTR